MVSQMVRSAQPMSALGQKQTFAMQTVMSAFVPRADMKGLFRRMQEYEVGQS